MRTNTATFEHTVESNVVVCTGADAYIPGIHAWKGINPNLAPNPITSIIIIAMETPGPITVLRLSHSERIGVPATEDI